jgi:CRISPR-associated protein Csm5
MKFLESCRLLISTLSPVHIGCDEDYDPTNYVIENHTLHEFEPSAVQKALTIQDRRELLRIVSNPNNQRMLQEVQAFFYQRRHVLIMVAKRRVPVVQKLVEFYQGRVGQTVQTEGDGSQLINKLAIGRTFFNPVSGAPILPGSSLKGAIRTALLDSINNGKPLLGEESRLAQSKISREQQSANRKLQQRLFQSREFEQDPMRLVQLMDAGFMDREGVGSELRFAVNRRRKAPKPGDSSTKSQAEQRDLYQLLECIPAARFRVFAGELTVQRVDSIYNGGDRLPSLSFRWDAQQIAMACNRFYRQQLEMELEQMRERGYLDVHWAKMIEQLLNGPVGQRLKQNQAFLLRVGRHSGAESMTLDGVRSIKIMLGQDGVTRRMNSENRATGTSWWLAASDTQARTGMLPFGWLLVELQPMDQPLLDWTETREALSGLSTEYMVWLERERQRVVVALRQQADEDARQQAAITRANATLEQKAIAELRDWFIADRKTKQLKPMGRVVGTLNRLLKEGLSWPLADRRALATLAEEIFNQKSIGGDDKAQRERQAKIQQLLEEKQ